VLGGIVGSKRDKVTGDYVTRSFMLCTLTTYHSGNQVKKTEMGRTCSMHGDRRGAYRFLVGKPKGRRSLGRPRHRQENNIKIDLREVGWWGTDCVDLVKDWDRWQALVNVVMNLWVP
jgi:hypothetical protein